MSKVFAITRVVHKYSCQFCGDEKTTESWGLIIFGYLVDLQWFPFVDIRKIESPAEVLR